jgi:hypothetical protein
MLEQFYDLNIEITHLRLQYRLTKVLTLADLGRTQAQTGDRPLLSLILGGSLPLG